MTISDFFKTNLLKLTKLYNEKTDLFFKYTGAAAWLTSCVAQIIVISTNRKITNDDKKYLIPQELGEGMINLTTLLFLTSVFKEGGAKLVKNGLVLPQAIVDKFKKAGIAAKDFPNELNKLADAKDPKLTSYIKGMSVLTTILGEVVAINFAAPYLRNKFAAFVQKLIKKSSKKPDTETRRLDIESPADEMPFKGQDILKNAGTIKINNRSLDMQTYLNLARASGAKANNMGIY